MNNSIRIVDGKTFSPKLVYSESESFEFTLNGMDGDFNFEHVRSDLWSEI